MSTTVGFSRSLSRLLQAIATFVESRSRAKFNGSKMCTLCAPKIRNESAGPHEISRGLAHAHGLLLVRFASFVLERVKWAKKAFPLISSTEMPTPCQLLYQ